MRCVVTAMISQFGGWTVSRSREWSLLWRVGSVLGLTDARGRKGGRKGFCEPSVSAYSTRVNAGIAQLVEQLICNQQVVGSNPTAGSPPKNSRLLCDSQISQRVIDRPCTGSRWLREDANSVPLQIIPCSALQELRAA